MNTLDQRLLTHIHNLAPCRWPLLLELLKVDREPLDLALGRQLRARTIVVTDLGFELRGKRLKVVKVEEPEEDDEVPEGEKLCSRCKDVHPKACFTRHSKTKDGLQSWCKFCQAEDHRRRRAAGYER